MKTMTKVAIAAAVLTFGAQTAAQAYSAAVNRVIDQMRAQGYRSFEVRRTLMGRIKIEADGRGGSREIIIDADTGHVFRDRKDREHSWRSGSSHNDRDDNDRRHNDRDDHDDDHGNDHDDD